MIQVLEQKTLRRLESVCAKKKELEDRSLDSLGFEESLKESVQELSAYDNHPADLASETFEREKDLGIYLDNKRQKYNNIQDALERIKMGKYGICAICGRSIEVERLEVLPQAINCLDCQKMMEAEGQKADGDRPIEEIVLAYPFGRTFLRDTTEVAFDGEDTASSSQLRYFGKPTRFGGNVTYEEMYTAEPREEWLWWKTSK